MDGADNFALMSNAEQLDRDSDGLGDVCDEDDDNDGITDGDDNCPFMANSDQGDADGKYVSCVTKAANTLRYLGLITGEEKGQITSEAAQSRCRK